MKLQSVLDKKITKPLVKNKPILLNPPSNDLFIHKKMLTYYDFYNANTFDINDFRGMPKELKEIIENKIPKNIKITATETIKPIKTLKNFLDKKYGRNKYIFVSIGTSPSTIAKGLEYEGVEVKYLPGSNLQQLLTNENINEIAPYLNYINSLGLNRNYLKCSGKKAIFYDYTATGESLRAIKYLTRKYGNLNLFNSRFRSLNKDLSTLANKMKSPTLFDNYLATQLNGCQAGLYSTIPHLYIEDFHNIKQIMDKNKYPINVKMFNFELFKLLEGC